MESLDVFNFRLERVEKRRKERSHADVRDEVFDRRTLMAVSRMVSRGFFSQVDYSISTGKVANVFRVTSAKGPRALKVYRVGNALFRSMPAYLLHDLREGVGSNSFGRLVFAWARREFMALKKCQEEGVPVPTPVEHYKNLLLMEFLGEGGLPYPTLVKSQIDDPERVLHQITTAVRKMTVKVGIVHGDLSPYNVLYDGKHIILIDMGESISAKHPEAKVLLKRDAGILAKYFRKLGVDIETADMFTRLGGDQLP